MKSRYERAELLPGVTGPEATPPTSRFNPAREIRAERLRTTVRDSIDVLFLMAVNLLFVKWPNARFPFLDRADSGVVLALVTATMLTYFVMRRLVPRYRARRIAATWSPHERRRFTH